MRQEREIYVEVGLYTMRSVHDGALFDIPLFIKVPEREKTAYDKGAEKMLDKISRVLTRQLEKPTA